MSTEENWTLCVLQLVLLLYHCYFLPHKFYGLSQKQRGLSLIKIFIFRLPPLLPGRQGQRARLKEISTQFHSLSRLEIFSGASKGRKTVIQMEISPSFVILTFIATTNVFILIFKMLLGRWRWHTDVFTPSLSCLEDSVSKNSPSLNWRKNVRKLEEI